MFSLFKLLLSTPWWVWVIFIYLLWVGINATKSRVVWLPKFFIIPAILMSLRLKLVLLSAPFIIVNYVVWLAASCLVDYLLTSKMVVKVLLSSKSIELPGSYQTLFVVMLLFFIKYIFGFLDAINHELAEKYLVLEISISAIFSGYFLGRALCLLQKFLNNNKATN